MFASRDSRLTRAGGIGEPGKGRRRVLRSLLTRARFTAAEMETARAIIGQSNAEVVCRQQAAEHLAEARLQLFGMTERPNWAVRALAEMVTTLESSLV